ncbi:MAG: hypothetical protein WC197_07110 [Candidatus Gastranaerophilaceae bacterium]|jgi:hypothetical protein
MKTFLIIIFKILYGIFSAICTLFVAYNIFIVSAHSFFSDNGFDSQIILYIILSFTLVIGFWSLIFVKIKPPFKILIFLLLLIVQLNYLKLAILLPSVEKIFDMELCIDINKDTCIDTGICAEGVRFGDDVVSKEYCLKKGENGMKKVNLVISTKKL